MFKKYILGLLILLPAISCIAQSDAVYIDGPYHVAAGESEQWYGDVTLGPNAKLYIEDDAKILFYGANFKMEPGAQIYGTDKTWLSFEQGVGMGTVAFQQPNPNNGFTIKQMLDGGNDGNSGNSNTFTSIEINNSKGVMLANSNTRLGTDMIFSSGNLYADTHDLVLDKDATLTGYDASKFVVTNDSGHLVKENYTGAFEFPVGMAENDYTPAKVNPTKANTIHVNVTNYDTSASVEDGIEGIDRTWNIYGSANTGAIIALQHNSDTNNSGFKSNSSFITQYGSSPNSTGDKTSKNGWQSNNPTTATISNGIEISSRAYIALSTISSEDQSFFTKESSVTNNNVESDIQVFNAISPNGDGRNDKMIIEGLDNYQYNTLEIFNRWGVKVYSTENYGQNGNYFIGISEGRATINQDSKLPTGTYFYVLKYVDANGNAKEKAGYLYLVR
ncbi:gliding motility-associated C-terminal domain-containing protein [Flavobacterium sp. TR2]|uniref:gliding motility-associated C-terminal domain-containing protein n=1 Tax=Flavobacterium sp. TR2 TaxID=2977321 RepID=UPI0021B0E159|nr:gliding motility-associated C-terminal domain-containing protein [Flavobacterium sp. TR2]UWY28023.1 gliding motility-associated C-terminal domain-containing protein [Flavobacterium sp. TR2]